MTDIEYQSQTRNDSAEFTVRFDEDDEYGRFERLTSALVAVPKEEMDAERKTRRNR